MLMSVPQENTSAVQMMCATIPRDHTIALVNLDTMKLEITAKKVRFFPWDICHYALFIK